MIRTALMFALLVVGLAACGADGPPTPPDDQPEPGVSMSGSVSIGLGGSL